MTDLEQSHKHLPDHIQSLNETVDAMGEKMKVLPTSGFTSKFPEIKPVNQSNKNPPSSLSHSNPCFSSFSSTTSEQKFNVIIHGLKEPAKGTPKQARSVNDHDAVINVLTSLDSNINPHSVRDCFRLGKYNEARSRPVLVSLTTAYEAMSILRKRYNSKKLSGVFVKPDLSPEERATESLLLRERKALISAGEDRRNIRIYGNALFVNKRKYGIVVNSTFQCLQPQNVGESSSSSSNLSSLPVDKSSALHTTNQKGITSPPK